MHSIQQQYIEQYLWEAVEKEPLIETRWQSKVVGVEDVEDVEGGVQLAVSDPHGTYTLEAAYVLAADGARSQMRKMRGLRLKEDNYEGRYVIADVQMPHDYPTIRRALFDPDCMRGATVLIHKQPDNIWRIDYQLEDDADEPEAMRESTVRDCVEAVLQEIGYDGAWALEWWSIYSANTLALDDYRDGRIFFIGDSAQTPQRVWAIHSLKLLIWRARAQPLEFLEQVPQARTSCALICISQRVGLRLIYRPSNTG